MLSPIQRSGKRRQQRRPSPWLLVEVATNPLGPDVTSQPLSGQLVDTSAGGLGLILSHPVPPGSLVRVTRGAAGDQSDASAGASSHPPKPHPWERREARVAYSTPLQHGGFRIGLAFKPEPPSTLELWATRALLSLIFLFVAAAATASSGPTRILGWSLTALLLLLAAGAEWRHHSEQQAYRRARSPWDTPVSPPFSAAA